MREFLVFLLTIVVWGVLWAVAAVLFTVLSVIAATLLERYMLLRERWTYPFWIVALGLCPPVAFLGSWTLFGLLFSEELYRAVRWGGLGAGIMFAVIAVLVVVRRPAKDDMASEVATLSASLLTDALCCAALIGFFGEIAGFMRSIGGG